MIRRVLASVLLALLAGACSQEAGDGSSGGPGDGSSDGADGSSDDTGAVAASTSTGAAPACDYPDGPYGNTVGAYLPADVVLSGIVEDGTERTDVRLGDLRDCDGRSGVGALLFIGARTTCSICNGEAPELAAELDELRERGIRVVILMHDGRVEAWRDFHGLQGALVLADPEETFYVPGNNPFSEEPNGTPMNVVVDPRTGEILVRDPGGNFDRTALYELADRNRP